MAESVRAIARGCRASRRPRSRNAPSRIRAVPGSSAATAGCSLPWPKMKNDRAVVVRWHSASFACGAEVWSLLDVQRTSGEAVGCVGPTRLTHCGHRLDRNPAAQQSPGVLGCAILSSGSSRISFGRSERERGPLTAELHAAQADAAQPAEQRL